MKGPNQRSSFHICDILDLNNASDAKNTQNNNNNSSTNNNNHNSTHPTYPPQSSPRDAESLTNLNDSIASTASSGLNSSLPTIIPPPPPPYQFTPNLGSAIYSELGHHYHAMFPSAAAAAKSWIKDEHYGRHLFILDFMCG